ncbi:hypothetical protein [Gemmobacter denitrificans]|uniref:Lipoprotein n=1 Tax=Gemmobacter denitrificans TaxID=3123040 RepID=A0ABU8BZQ1_9RHOB
MIGASKILTVSYGTFSCTLEGFDDPFNTMKAIAEYFRDLAAEDRYFGAEPPTPDAAMLHRIAEREIQRRVEAKIQENGVILRAGDASEPLPIPRAALAEPAPQPKVAAPVEVAAVEPAQPASEADNVAAKLSRIRNAVAQARATAAPAPLTAPAVTDLYEEDLAEPAANLAETSTADLAPAPIADSTPEEVAEVLAEGDSDDLSALEDLLPEDAPDLTEEALPELATAEEDPLDAELIAAATTVETEGTSAEDDILAALAEDLADTKTTADDLTVVVENTSAPAEVLATADEDDLLASLAALDVTADTDGITAKTPVTEAKPADPLDDELDALLAALDAQPAAAAKAQAPAELAPVVEESPASLPEFDSATLDETDDLGATGAPDLAETQDDAPAAQAETETALARIQRARARVIRIRRSDAEPAQAATSTAAQDSAEPVLPPEAEAALLRELEAARTEAEIETEADAVAEPAPAAPAQPAAVAPVRPSRPVRPTRPVADARTTALANPESEAAVSRLIAEANTQMEGPESRRRLSAIQHLKAAVAATVAERRAGLAKPVNEEERIDPYRADLSRMVRPAAPRSSTPLVLVSEQRIDRPTAPAPMSPQAPVAAQTPRSDVQPMRVQSQAAMAVAMVEDEEEEDTNIFTDARGFAEFAEQLGARNLAELIEAAAAYAACVEGRAEFTRPQLMRQVAELGEGTDAQREDSLRSFGTLLRTGTIQRIQRGRYVLSPNSHFLTEARKITG